MNKLSTGPIWLINRALLENLLDYLYSLREAWQWKQSESRCNYQGEYAELTEHINKLEKMLSIER